MIDDRPLYPVDPWRIRELTFDAVVRGAQRDDLLAGQRPPRDAGEPRGGGRKRRPRDVRERLLRGGADRLRRGGVRLRAQPPGAAQRRRRQAHAAVRRRRAPGPLDRQRRGIRAVPRPAHGILARTVRWRAPGGTTVEVVARRLVSLARPAIAAIDLAVTRIDGDAPLRIVSAINAGVRNQEASNDPRVGAHLPEGSLRTVAPRGPRAVGRDRPADAHHAARDRGRDRPPDRWRRRLTASSGLDGLGTSDGDGSPGPHGLASPGVHGLGASAGRIVAASAGESGYALTIELDPPVGRTVAVTKLLAYGTSHDHPEEELVDWARDELAAVPDGGFEALAAEQREALDRFWAASDVEIDGDGALQQGAPVQPVQPVPVGRPRRPDEPRGQGPLGRGLRGPLLLGHRDLRPAVLRLHPARRSRGPCSATGAGSWTRPARGPSR